MHGELDRTELARPGLGLPRPTGRAHLPGDSEHAPGPESPHVPPGRLTPAGSASVSPAQPGSTKHVPSGRLPLAGSASVGSAQQDDTNCTPPCRLPLS